MPAPPDRPYPQRPRAQEGKWTERGLVCQQAGAQAAQVLWPSWPGKSLAGPQGEGQTPPGTDTPSGFTSLLQLPPPQDFITSHQPFTHQCESQGHSWSVHLAPQKPVLSSSPQAPCSLVTPVLVQFPGPPFALLPFSPPPVGGRPQERDQARQTSRLSLESSKSLLVILPSDEEGVLYDKFSAF